VPHEGGFLCLTRYDPNEGPYSSSVHWDWDAEHWGSVEVGTHDHIGGGQYHVSADGSSESSD
jgi:hypothetical protein